MRSRHRFREALRELDPDLVRFEADLWSGLGDWPDATEQRLRRRVWARLRRSRSPFWMALTMWRASWRMLFNRKAALLLLGMLIAIVMAFIEPLIPGLGELTWWGILAPWAGFLAVPLLARTSDEGPWAEWEAAAPLDSSVATIILWFTVLLGVSMVMLPVSWASAGSITLGSHLGLIWLGPYALTSLVTILLARRTGMVWAVLISAVFWGVQLVAGATLGWDGAGSGWLWFLNLRGQIWPDGLALAVAIVLAGWQFTRQAARWTFA